MRDEVVDGNVNFFALFQPLEGLLQKREVESFRVVEIVFIATRSLVLLLVQNSEK